MSVCICGESALELYRASGRLAPDLLDRRRTSKLDGCGLPPAECFAEDLYRLGVKRRPYHILVDEKSGGRSREDVVCHRCSGPLPMKSLICVDANTLVTSPALTFLQLAYTSEQGAPARAPRASRAGASPRKTRAKKPRDIEEIALLGMELCGTYVLDESWDGLTNTDAPLTSVAKIGRVLDARHNAAGVAHARAALELVHDGSNSPMESVLCALMAWPRRLGGCGFGPVALNYRVVTALGERYVDVAFPEHRVGLEYKGRESHSVEQVGRDDRRQNELVGSGWTIINVWYEDLAQPHLFERLVGEVARALGVRLRSRSATFEVRRELLRSRLVQSMREGCGAEAHERNALEGRERRA